MIKKTMHPYEGIRASLDVEEKKKKPKRYTAEPQSRVDICLNCTKPVSECKGKCFGKC